MSESNETRTVKIAIYLTEYGQEIIFYVSDFIEDSPKYIRLSEIIDVEIPMLMSHDNRIMREIDIVNSTIDELSKSSTNKMIELQERKKELEKALSNQQQEQN